MSNGSARASPRSLISRGERESRDWEGIGFLSSPQGEGSVSHFAGCSLPWPPQRMYTEWLCERCDVPDTLTCLLTFNITAHCFQSLSLRFT